jgi:hypothetical protein
LPPGDGSHLARRSSWRLPGRGRYIHETPDRRWCSSDALMRYRSHDLLVV